ncbi:Krr1-domain-containing protein [Corynespora cassiicola Philippines]|uniref:Krr1-domain-containing protein n=1 Tax=Corynespora cassiicola Philippines TaxID=1448308 RepID=A0A2T2NS12_CORCC|nr:Krr1-domain-containing protein [Corynespora cassiicola Philippines]
MPRPKKNKSDAGLKRDLDEDVVKADAPEKRPAKKVKLLDDSDDDSDADADVGGVSLKVNEEYARRFEHNKKREEQHRLEEKYGKGRAFQEQEEEEDSEEGVEEDDDAELATENLDAEISATLKALRSKDPRIYDKDAKFFHEVEEGGAEDGDKKKKEPTMTLKQYHTKNLLEGNLDSEEEDAPPKTYAEEQEEARQNLVKELNVDDDEEDDDFLVAKPKSEKEKKEERVKLTQDDVENADKDPETFLDNFMASRAWLPTGDSRFQPLESDDDDDDVRADEYEAAYNMYFEDPSGTNEKLVTYARDAVANTTVRREEPSGRKKARETARAKREAERKEREEELARLRKLKIDEMEEKVKKIREIGGLSGRDFKVDEWKDVLENDWSDDQWDAEMRKRFGDSYYDENEEMDEDGEGKKRKKPKKPKFDDDIDIKDLIPDFEDEEAQKPTFDLTDGEDEVMADADEVEEEGETKKSSKKRKQERAEAKSAARRDRRLIENLVDDSLKYESALASKKSSVPARFRYRETSPTSFGLTARDILLADDTQLNEFAGLKKFASFRDPAKKKKDKKHLSKKARLRQWRLDTFGDPDGPKGGFEDVQGEDAVAFKEAADKAEEAINGGEDSGQKKKKKRSRKKKSAEAEV